MTKFLFLPFCIVLSCLGSGCELPGYQFGDVTRGVFNTAKSVFEAKQAYCNSNDPDFRAFILQAIRKVEPEYQGVCSDN